MGFLLGAGLIAGLGGSLFKGITGSNQIKRGREGLANLERPEYSTPAAIDQMLNIAKFNAARNMPGMSNLIGSVNTNQANAAALAKESGNPLAAIAGIQGASNKARRNIDVQNQEYLDRKMSEQQRALMHYATYKDREFMINKLAPYTDKYNEYREMTGAGQKNIGSALGDLSSLLISGNSLFNN